MTKNYSKMGKQNQIKSIFSKSSNANMLFCFIHLNDLGKTFLKCFTCWRTFSGSRDIAKNRRARQYIGFCGPWRVLKSIAFLWTLFTLNFV